MQIVQFRLSFKDINFDGKWDLFLKEMVGWCTKLELKCFLQLYPRKLILHGVCHFYKKHYLLFCNNCSNLRVLTPNKATVETVTDSSDLTWRAE